MKKFFLMAVAAMMATMMWATKPSVTFDFTDPEFQINNPISEKEGYDDLTITQGPVVFRVTDDDIYYEDEEDNYLTFSGNNSSVSFERTSDDYLITRVEFHIGYYATYYWGLQHFKDFANEGDNGFGGETLVFDNANFIESFDYEYGAAYDEWSAVESEASVKFYKVVVYYTGGPSTALNENEFAIENRKVVENGQLIIIRDGVRYNAMGQIVE